jgi:hypothetical protein
MNLSRGDTNVGAGTVVTHRSFHLPVWAAVALSLMAAGSAEAQTTIEPALKAAFVYNIARFAEWPAGVLSVTAPLRLCVANDAVATELERMVGTATIGAHRIVIARVGEGSAAQGCHVLYVGGLDSARARQLISALKDAPVLSISDFDGFATLGGIAQVFIESGKIRFAINVDSVHHARLRISSRLLGLATIVKDARDAR